MATHEFSRFERIPSTHDVSWLLDLHKNGQLDLEPAYQRRSVWTPRDRRSFMDTVFRNYPAHPIFLHKSIDGDTGSSTYHVVDGKQRITSILMFIANKVYLPDDFGDSTLAGKRWKDLDGDIEAKKLLWNYRLTVEQLDNIEPAVVKDVFERLNKNSSKLTAQELRHARFDGWLITRLEQEAIDDIWQIFKIRTTAKQKRMTEVQNISELAAVVIRKSVSGFDQLDIDGLYADYDDADGPDTQLDTDSFNTDFALVKNRMLDLENEANLISKVSQPFFNFYTLWAYLALNPLEESKTADFAQDYELFMKKVAEYQVDETREAGPDVDRMPVFERSVARYKQASVGATTEGPQRRERLAALTAAMTVEKDTEN